MVVGGQPSVWSPVINRVKREPPPPSLEEGRKTGGRRSTGGSKLAAHGLWSQQTKKKEHQQKPLKKHGKHAAAAALKKKKTVVKIADDEDMLADGSGSGDGPSFQGPPPLAPPSQPTGDGTRSESCLLLFPPKTLWNGMEWNGIEPIITIDECRSVPLLAADPGAVQRRTGRPPKRRV